EIIESRLAEICDLINNELRSIAKAGRLPGGVVISGGGAKLPGMVELFRDELKLSAQIGLPSTELFHSSNDGAVDILELPEYASVLGLLLWSRELHPQRQLLNGNIALRFLKNLLP
ncbi:MAG: hypothetical protein HYR95_00345, partial [Candidatus Colwellbacteria bacterium]|nr:hypothetical protein [Candidatus Colwellbacteria bacterium]